MDSASPLTKPAGGRIRRGWSLSKSSWHVLKADKELIALPLFSALVSIGAMVLFAAVYVGAASAIGTFWISGQNFSVELPGWAGILMGLLFYAVMTIIANFFSAAIIYGATERFNGGDPSVRSSLAGVRRKFRPLLLFSLMMATVGYTLQLLEQRVPFAGKIAVWLFNAAWSIANVFALPVIVLSKEDVAPLTATRKSVGIIKKIWGESIVADLAIGAIAGLTLLGYIVISFLLSLGVYGISHGPATAIIAFAALFVIGAILITLVFSALTGIAKAALYHYATTGEAPEQFNRDMLRASMTPKKARKVFGS